MGDAHNRDSLDGGGERARERERVSGCTSAHGMHALHGAWLTGLGVGVDQQGCNEGRTRSKHGWRMSSALVRAGNEGAEEQRSFCQEGRFIPKLQGGFKPVQTATNLHSKIVHLLSRGELLRT